MLGLYTALRIGDILQLKWRMVYDFNKHHFFDHIYINEQKNTEVECHCTKPTRQSFSYRIF